MEVTDADREGTEREQDGNRGGTMCPDMITLMHMLTMIAGAHEVLKTRIITAPSGRSFLPGDAVHDFLNSVQDALDLYVEISLETLDAYTNLLMPDIKNMN